MDDAAFVELIARARGGDAAAVAALLRSFEGEVRMMVRVRLPRALRTQFDSMDFVQAVWQSVFASPDRPALDFETAGHFRGFLAGVAQNKVFEEHRRRTRTQKYDLRREERLYVRKGDGETPLAVAAADPTPSQEVQADDCMEQLAAGRSPVEIEILRLRRQGLTFEEVAAETGLHERTVRRVIATIRARMEARQWQ